MTSKRKWKAAGLFYFSVLFFLIPSQASAYIDPSVTSYAVQALAGVLVAAGAFFAAYGRKTRRLILKGLGIDDHSGKVQEPEAQIYMEELLEETAARKAAFEASRKGVSAGNGKADRIRCLVLSLICGLAAAMTFILRPTICFYLDNENEFWFSLGSVIGNLLLIFGLTAAVIALIHALLPDRKIRSPRLLLAVLVAAVTLCAYIQNHFMSSYLPLLTGDPIDWSHYTKWGLASIALWGGVVALAVAGFVFHPRTAKVLSYGILALLLVLETFAGGYTLATAEHEDRETNTYFSTEGLFQVSKAGNIVILVSDTFEGTYMNAILERYPEYRDMLDDITYYDNVTGVSVFTYLSYGQFLTGVDFPLDADSTEGLDYCFEHETTISAVHQNGWDIGYYTKFSPTENLRDKLVNFVSDRLIPDAATAQNIATMMVRSTLFQSLPQFLKPYFMVYSVDYEQQKKNLVNKTETTKPFTENDRLIFDHIKDEGLEAYEGKPKYSVIELLGVHAPSVLNAEFEEVEYSEDVPILERKIEAGRAQLNLLRRYLDDLKKAGVYEDSTVIMTADHGFGMRYYPVFLVKEAHRKATGFQTDHTPLSVLEDLKPLLNNLSSGRTFTEAVQNLQLPQDRTRHALSYHGETYKAKTESKTVITIEGEAKDPASYRIEQDTFAINEDFAGRCSVGVPFISGGALSGDVAVYGLEGGFVYSNTVLFDVILPEPADRDLTMRLNLVNVRESKQRVIAMMDGHIIGEDQLNAGEQKEVSIALPVQKNEKFRIELKFPDTEVESPVIETMGWVNYRSAWIDSAVIE